MKVERILPPTGVAIECDGYVPLVARNIGEFTYCEKYWRTGDFKNTILEFGVKPTDGTICKVTVTLMGKFSRKLLPFVELCSIRDGVPCLDLMRWHESAKSLDDHGPFDASLVKDRLVIRFSNSDAKICHGIRNGRLIYVVDSDDELTGIEVLDLSSQEINNIMYTLGAA